MGLPWVFPYSMMKTSCLNSFKYPTRGSPNSELAFEQPKKTQISWHKIPKVWQRAGPVKNKADNFIHLACLVVSGMDVDQLKSNWLAKSARELLNPLQSFHIQGWKPLTWTATNTLPERSPNPELSFEQPKKTQISRHKIPKVWQNLLPEHQQITLPERSPNSELAFEQPKKTQISRHKIPKVWQRAGPVKNKADNFIYLACLMVSGMDVDQLKYNGLA
jgi:hypothetical protein